MSYKNRPSHLFGGIGAISVLIGSTIMTYLLYLRLIGESIGGRPLLILSVLVISVGFQLILFGLLAELVVYAQKKKNK
jgi:dolichol-phosphate mannosyltransferase